MGKCCTDTYELGHTAPNSETRTKGFLFGGLTSEAPVRPVPTCCYLPPRRVLPAVFMVQLGGVWHDQCRRAERRALGWLWVRFSVWAQAAAELVTLFLGWFSLL